ncbi:MAG: ankyrin repeat domain-containing protein [Acidobacteriia bacterium]|nr:ankyrin repeat domain-containing protein [Terriglobia bacterium]
MRNACLAACLALWAISVPIQAEEPDALYNAIRANDLTGLKSILDRGANPNAPDARQVTPLMYAAETGSVESMQILLEHHAEVNAQNAFGSTALIWSVADRRKVRLLLDHGADPNKAARSGRTALIIAAFTNPSAQVVRMLLDHGADPKAMDQHRWTALNAAAFGNDTDTIKLLVAAGVPINTPDNFIGWTPLMNAAGNGNLEAVKLLLSKGAEVNAVSLREGLPKVKTGTVEFGGFTPLLTAAAFAPPPVIKTLLDAGAEVNVADVRGFTPLMLATATDRSNPETVRLLLAKGAGTGAKNLDGETAADWSRKIGMPPVMEALGAAAGQGRPAPPPAEKPELRTAVTRSVKLLETTSAAFFVKSACFACHEQVAADLAVAAARRKGIAFDEKAASDRRRQIVSLNPTGPTSMEGPGLLGGADNTLYAVEALVRTGYQPDRGTDFLAANLAAQQSADGSWRLGGYSRSPMQDGNFSRTAMAMRALQAYGTPGRAQEMSERIARGKAWLLRTAPVITEDWDMRLIGAAAADAGGRELRDLAKPILSRQLPNGGWAQRENLPADAYATGMALSALAETGVIQPKDAVYQRAVDFLLSTQKEDGSWHVSSRATKFQDYFESGFPYRHDQWISTMATAWAANALALAIDESPGSVAGR